MSPRFGPCSLEAPLVADDRLRDRAIDDGVDQEPEPDTLRDWAPFRAAFEPAPTTLRSGEAPRDEGARSNAVAEEIERLFGDLSPLEDDDFALDELDLGSSQIRMRALGWGAEPAQHEPMRANEAITEPPPARRVWR
jgi:hypothetical protein